MASTAASTSFEPRARMNGQGPVAAALTTPCIILRRIAIRHLQGAPARNDRWSDAVAGPLAKVLQHRVSQSTCAGEANSAFCC